MVTKRAKSQNDVHLWLGCTSRSFLKSSVKNLYVILDRLEIDYRTIDDTDICCGSVLFVTGQNQVAMENLKTVEKTLSKKNTHHLVSLCPGCTRTFKEFYLPRRSNPLAKVEHYTELLKDRLHKLEFKENGKFKVTYHDPCHLARHMDIIEPPREIIKALPGVTFTELPTNKNDAFCCGSGGGLRSYNKDMANDSSMLRLKEAETIGAEILLTSCPFCERSLRNAQELKGAPKHIEILNLIDFLPRYIR
jgi:Fe-S oxidoreductase